MHQDKNAKSMEFPAGNWPVFFQRVETDPLVYIGRLNLVLTSSPTETPVGAMHFNSNPQFKGIAGLAFPVGDLDFDEQNGEISFRILAAATMYDPKTSGPYHFVFEGTYTQAGGFSGTAKIPLGFGVQAGPPGDDGENALWSSGGSGSDLPHKHPR